LIVRILDPARRAAFLLLSNCWAAEKPKARPITIAALISQATSHGNPLKIEDHRLSF